VNQLAVDGDNATGAYRPCPEGPLLHLDARPRTLWHRRLGEVSARL
jgi:hypothetical protein